MAQPMRSRRRAAATPATPVVDEAKLVRIVRADLTRLAIIVAGLLVMMVILGNVLR